MLIGLGGEREAGGITISFHPKRRASIEKAPGPRRAIAAEMAINWAIASFEPEKVHTGSGNQESAIPKTLKARKRAEYGGQKANQNKEAAHQQERGD